MRGWYRDGDGFRDEDGVDDGRMPVRNRWRSDRGAVSRMTWQQPALPVLEFEGWRRAALSELELKRGRGASSVNATRLTIKLIQIGSAWDQCEKSSGTHERVALDTLKSGCSASFSREVDGARHTPLIGQLPR